jgi:hypothetical protein
MRSNPHFGVKAVTQRRQVENLLPGLYDCDVWSDQQREAPCWRRRRRWRRLYAWPEWESTQFVKKDSQNAIFLKTASNFKGLFYEI